MQLKETKKLFQNLILMGENIEHIYEKINMFDQGSSEYKKELEHLELATEYEETLYNQVTKENIHELLFYFETKYGISEISTQNILKNIPSHLLPLYRIFFHLNQLKKYYEEPQLGPLNIFLNKENQEKIKNEIKESYFKGVILDLQFRLVFANVSTLLGLGNQTDYYKIIYLHPILESELLKDGFPIIPEEETLDFVKGAWLMFQMKQEKQIKPIEIPENVKETFFAYQVNDIKEYLNSLLNDKQVTLDENYLLACYACVTESNKALIIKMLQKLINSSQLSNKTRVKGIYIYEKILEMISYNRLIKKEKGLIRKR